MLPGTSLTSTSNFFSSTLVFGSWTGLRLFQEACLVFCSNFSSRARKLRVKSTQARLSQLPLGIGDAVVVGDVAENLGPKDKVELLRQVLGDREEGKLDEERPGLRRLAGSNIYVGASLRGMRIKNAEFIKSSSNVAECPRDGLPEFAVVGRSNVGKSSLVNTLVRRKDLAQTSKKPGIVFLPLSCLHGPARGARQFIHCGGSPELAGTCMPLVVFKMFSCPTFCRQDTTH